MIPRPRARRGDVTVGRMLAASVGGGLVAGLAASAVALLAALTIPASWDYPVFASTPVVVVAGVWIGAAVGIGWVRGHAPTAAPTLRLAGAIALVGLAAWVVGIALLPGVVADVVAATAVPVIAAPFWIAARR